MKLARNLPTSNVLLLQYPEGKAAQLFHEMLQHQLLCAFATTVVMCSCAWLESHFCLDVGRCLVSLLLLAYLPQQLHPEFFCFFCTITAATRCH